MAKVTGGLLSVEASGTFGKSLTFLKNRVVTRTHKPSGLPSTAQSTVRTIFFNKKEAWNALDSDAKLVWTERAKPLKLTGYNLFLKEYTGAPTDMLKTVKATLTHDQILNLPTTPITLVERSSPLNLIVPLSMTIIGRCLGGAYNNIDADAYIQVGLDNSLPSFPWLLNKSSVGLAQVTNLLQNISSLSQYDFPLGSTSTDPHVLDDLALVFTLGTPYGTGIFRDLVIFANNNGAGNFTDGEAGNVLKVIISYFEIDMSEFD